MIFVYLLRVPFVCTFRREQALGGDRPAPHLAHPPARAGIQDVLTLSIAQSRLLEWGGEARLTAEVTPGATPMGGVWGNFVRRRRGGPPHECVGPRGARKREKSLFS